MGHDSGGGLGVSFGENRTLAYFPSSASPAAESISGCELRIWLTIPVFAKLFLHCVQTRILYSMKKATAVALSHMTLYP